MRQKGEIWEFGACWNDHTDDFLLELNLKQKNAFIIVFKWW